MLTKSDPGPSEAHTSRAASHVLRPMAAYVKLPKRDHAVSLEGCADMEQDTRSGGKRNREKRSKQKD